MDVYRDFQHAQQSRYHIEEGSIVDGQVEYIVNLLQARPDITAAFETGFNGGRSAAAILSARPDVTLVSFDIADWDYVDKAKALIDARFPGRHTLVRGDTLQTIPEFVKGREGSFQFGLIDGGHVAPVPESDIRLACRLLCPEGLLMVDDYCQLYGAQGVVAGYDAALSLGSLETAEGPMTSEDRTWILAKTKTTGASPTNTVEQPPVVAPEENPEVIPAAPLQPPPPPPPEKKVAKKKKVDTPAVAADASSAETADGQKKVTKKPRKPKAIVV